MKRKMLLLTLAAMLFGWCGAMAQHEPFFTDKDTLWTREYPPGYRVTDAKFNPDGKTLVVLRSKIGLVELDAETGDSLRKFKHIPQTPQDTIITRFDISPDGNLLFAVDNGGRCYLWSLVSGELIRGFDQYGTQGFFLQNSSKIYVHNNHSSGNNNNLWIYNIETDSVENVLNIGNYTQTTGMGISKDDKYIVAAKIFKDYNQNPFYSIDIFDAATFEKIVNVHAAEPGVIGELKFSSNSKWLSTRSFHGFEWNIINIEKLINFGVKEEKVIKVAWRTYFSEDENYLYTAYRSSYMINLNTNDTLFTNETPISIFDFDKVNKRYALYFDKYFTVSNSNLYYLDVPYSADETSVITMLNYQNGLLNYAANIEYINSIMITDISGTTVYSNSSGFSTTEGQVQIALAKGVYFFTVSYGNKSFSKKFIVIE